MPAIGGRSPNGYARHDVTAALDLSLSFRGVFGGSLAFLAGENFFCNQAGILPNRRVDLAGNIGIGLEKDLGILAALADALTVEGEPSAGFFHHAGFNAKIDQFAGFRDALAVHDVEFDLLEWRRELVLDHFHAGLIADDLVAFLDRADAADVETHGSVEFERMTAGRRFRRAIHDADLHADLV